jgi:hypothetical protein
MLSSIFTAIVAAVTSAALAVSGFAVDTANTANTTTNITTWENGNITTWENGNITTW